MDTGTDQPFFVFVHIPRTAGTSITAVLRSCFPPGEIQSLGNIYKGGGGSRPRRVARLRDSPPKALVEGVRVLTGHVPYGFTPHLPADTRYVTILRKPVERALSHYHAVLRTRKRQGPLIAAMTPEEILADRELIIDNLQTRMVAGVADATAKIDEATLEQAKRNLAEAFAAFGITERYDESLVLIARTLGVRAVPGSASRVTGDGVSDVSDAVRSALVRLNTFDRELYAWAAERFDERVAEQGLDLELEVARLRIATISTLVEEAHGALGQLREQLERVTAGADVQDARRALS